MGGRQRDGIERIACTAARDPEVEQHRLRAGDDRRRRHIGALPVAAILFVAGKMNEYHSIVRRFQLGNGRGGDIRIELAGEQNIVDDDIGVKVVP